MSGDGSQKVAELMALGCNPIKKVNNVEEGFAEYPSNKSFWHEHFLTCPRTGGLTTILVFFID